MGNRAFLYVGASADFTSRDANANAFAEANNTFPSLWRLLLANGAASTPIVDQRVFGDAGTPGLRSRAIDGLARIRALQSAIREHPLIDSQPHIDMMFDALVAHLDATITGIAPHAPDDVWFSADLDELSWLDGAPPERFIENERRTCDAVAERVAAAIEAHDFPSLDHALEIDSLGATFAHWGSWAWNFGFGGLLHPYFFLRDDPQTIPFDEFTPEPDAFGDEDGDDESWLGEGLERVRENGFVGVMRTGASSGRKRKDAGPTLLIPAEWDAIDTAGRESAPLFWVRRDDRYGLLRATDAGCTLLLPCTLEKVWSFERAANRWVAVVMMQGSMGLLGDDGQWIARPDTITPPLDEVWTFTGRYAVAASGERQGVIDATGRWLLPPTYESVDDLRETGVAIVTTGAERLLIDASTAATITQPQRELHWREDAEVFEGKQEADGTTGWWGADGAPIIAPAWDAIAPLQVTPLLVRVERNGLSGVRDRDDRECVAVAWDSVALRNDVGYDMPPEHLHEYIVMRDEKLGLVGDHNRVLVPAVYDGIGNFPPLGDDSHGVPRLYGPAVQVMRSTPDGERIGAWSLTAAREIIPPEYDHLYAVTLFRDRDETVRGFLAVQYAPGDPDGDRDPLRVGLLREDGSVLHAAQYAWIAERHHVTEYLDAMLVARAVARSWSKGEPVRAARSTENRYEWLTRDGAVLDDAATLTARFTGGDYGAAHTLGRQYRDGEGLPMDPDRARRWMLLAAGQPETVFDTPSPGLFRRLLGARAASPLFPASPDPRGDLQAMCDLAQLLITDTTDPENASAARDWIELAVARAHDDSPASAEAHMLLGYMLLEGVGGPADEARAYEYSSKAATLGSTSASFNLAVMYESGRGVTLNRASALRHYRTAAKDGDLQADLCLGRLMVRDGDDGTPADGKTAKQAVYHLQRAMDAASDATAAAAKAELGMLYWRGIGVKRDRARAESLLRDAATAEDAAAIAFLSSEVDRAR